MAGNNCNDGIAQCFELAVNFSVWSELYVYIYLYCITPLGDYVQGSAHDVSVLIEYARKKLVYTHQREQMLKFLIESSRVVKTLERLCVCTGSFVNISAACTGLIKDQTYLDHELAVKLIYAKQLKMDSSKKKAECF